MAAMTVTVIWSVAVAELLSVTEIRNTYVPARRLLKLNVGVPEFVIVAVGPLSFSQRYEAIVPSASVAVAVRLAVLVGRFTVLSVPAFTVGN